MHLSKQLTGTLNGQQNNMTTEYEPVIGLEVHAQLLTKSKLFCSSSAVFGAAPNHNIDPLSTGQPGALPVLNKLAVEFAVRAGLATHCTIHEKSVFARKNYFYPDLPKGYQISQYDEPICTNGYIDCAVDGTTMRINIQRIHMEEDAGKSIHDLGSSAVSHVDLNRAGVPLIEIVSGPDLRTATQSTAYLKTLRAILMYLEICDGNMQEGSLRCDANISVRPRGTEKFGTRAELKNLNSFRYVEKAINYEIARQIAVIEGGDKVVQETRLWDEKENKTKSMRGKEEAHDYRYFPDPDLPPLVISSSWINEIKNALPELPEQKIERYQKELELTEYDARVLTGDKAIAEFFETAIKEHNSPKKIANWITTELLGHLNKLGEELDECKIRPHHIAGLVKLIDDGTISGKIAKKIFAEMYESGTAPAIIVEKQGLKQISDSGELEKIVDDIITKETKNVELYKSGKTGVMGFFVGQVMKATKGQANPQLVNELLRKKLD